jgi:hypothetical protein
MANEYIRIFVFIWFYFNTVIAKRRQIFLKGIFSPQMYQYLTYYKNTNIMNVLRKANKSLQIEIR